MQVSVNILAHCVS